MKKLVAASVVVGSSFVGFPAFGQTEIGPMDDIRAEVNALGPGAELILRGGTYNLDFRFSISVQGTEQQPIVIRSKDGEVATITRPNAGQNTINIEDSAHVILRGLEIRGGSHGIRMQNSNFITIEGCEIHQTADVAFSANIDNNSYEGLIFRDNHVHDTNGTGEGMYLGCNDARCTLFNSVIEGNYIHDTLGTDQGDGIEVKHGSYGNIVRDNVIHDTNYPCILAYGTEGNPQNIIERNIMWGCGDHGIQVAADAIVRNNIILSANSNGIHNQVHQGARPGNLEIVHNTIIVQNDAIRTNDVSSGPVLVANNAIYSQGGNAFRASGNMGMVTFEGNVGVGNSPGGLLAGNLMNDFMGVTYAVGSYDAFPVAGSALIDAGVAAHVTDVDFNGTPRNGEPHAGAYHYDASGNPGWEAGPGAKGTVTTGGGTGGGTNGTGGGRPGTGAASGAGGSGAAGIDDSGSDGGCSCRAVGSSGGPGAAVLVLLPLLAVRRRRRVS